jgi:hypothetical protein
MGTAPHSGRSDMRVNIARATKILLLAGVLWSGCSQRPGEGLPEPGTDFYAVSPDTVTEVLLSTGLYKLFAFRWSPGDRFQLVVSLKGKAVEQCQAGPPFENWLKAVTRMPVVRQIDRPFDAESQNWGNLRLRDNTRLEPVEVRLRIPSAGSEPAVIEVGTRQFIVDLNAAILGTASSGCRALGRD